MIPAVRNQCTFVLKIKRHLNLFSFAMKYSSGTPLMRCSVTISRRMHFGSEAPLTYREGPPISRYYPPSAIELAEEQIKELLSKTSPQTTEEWNEIKNELMSNSEVFSDVNFSSIIMNCLLMFNKFKEANSFMSYLKASNIEPNQLTYLKYMALCGKNIQECGQEIILQTFNKVKPYFDTAPVLDQTRATHLIQGISETDKWRLSLVYVRKIPYNPIMEIKNCIAAAAIRNDDENLAWEILTKWLREEYQPNTKVLKEFLCHAIKLQSMQPKKSELFLTRFLEYVKQKNVIMDEAIVHLIEEYFKRHSTKWKISYTKVNRTGECNSCKTSLKLVELSSNDFNYLRDSFLQKSVKKTDLFINTTEAEFDRFIKFVNSKAPFHVVFDGLNISHTTPGMKNNKYLAEKLLKVVQQFSKPSQKLLVLGRRHMIEWYPPIMKKISKMAHIFLTSNISQDDPFLVYAALASGPHSYIVSSDLLRDHVSRLDDNKLISLFKAWQKTHQFYVFPEENNNVKIIEPLKYTINVQGSMKDGWHIPYDDKIILEPYEELNNWLCVQKTL